MTASILRFAHLPLTLSSPITTAGPISTLALVGRKEQLLNESVMQHLPPTVRALWPAMVQSVVPGDRGKTCSTWAEIPAAVTEVSESSRNTQISDQAKTLSEHATILLQVIAAVLPESCSRHNSTARPHAISELLREALPEKGPVNIIVALTHGGDLFAAGCAIARTFPLFGTKTKSQAAGEPGEQTLTPQDETRLISTYFFVIPSADDSNHSGTEEGSTEGGRNHSGTPGGTPEEELRRLEEAAEGIRLAARLVDTPTNTLNTDALLNQAQNLAAELGVTCTVWRGAALEQQGFGGLWGVGCAAAHPPALAVLSYTPAAPTPNRKTLAWVGKGLVYDTGGLSLKARENMLGMKADMAGAAAVLAAFGAAVRLQLPFTLHAVLCLAENAIGPQALRHDDIITLYSGKTVEINNSDAEGRLVLGDGVAYAARHLAPDIIVTLATLTGAQPTSTGKRHAAVITNDAALETTAVDAGRRSGDLVHPLPYCPEFFRQEFRSKVADLKNSVKDRMNAQSSCAAQFVAEHLGNYAGAWLHVDMVGPSTAHERGTGFGVALLLQLCQLWQHST